MKKLLAFSAVVLMVVFQVVFSPKSCCGDFGDGPPPDDAAVAIAQYFV